MKSKREEWLGDHSQLGFPRELLSCSPWASPGQPLPSHQMQRRGDISTPRWKLSYKLSATLGIGKLNYPGNLFFFFFSFSFFLNTSSYLSHQIQCLQSA